MEILRENLAPKKYDAGKDNPFRLPQFVINQIKKATANGTRNFHAGYKIAKDYLETDEESAGEQRIYWFRKAVEINSNQKSSIANQFIRGVNKAAANFDKREMTPFRQQWLSDQIGGDVIRSILREKAVPPLKQIIQTDVLATLSSLKSKNKHDLSNWAGSYYFWHVPITIDGKTQPIGKFISANKEMMEKFVVVQAGGAVRVRRSGSADTPEEIAEMMDQIFDPKYGPGYEVRFGIAKSAFKTLLSSDDKKELKNQPKRNPEKQKGKEKPDEKGSLLKEPEHGPTPTLKAKDETETDEKNTLLGSADDATSPLTHLLNAQAGEEESKIEKKITLTGKRFDVSPSLSSGQPALTPKIDKIEELTPELIADNPFTPDESGKTNLTKEAQILKKNKKLGLKLIQLAGRGAEFAPFFQGEDLD